MISKFHQDFCYETLFTKDPFSSREPPTILCSTLQNSRQWLVIGELFWSEGVSKNLSLKPANTAAVAAADNSNTAPDICVKRSQKIAGRRSAVDFCRQPLFSASHPPPIPSLSREFSFCQCRLRRDSDRRDQESSFEVCNTAEKRAGVWVKRWKADAAC